MKKKNHNLLSLSQFLGHGLISLWANPIRHLLASSKSTLRLLWLHTPCTNSNGHKRCSSNTLRQIYICTQTHRALFHLLIRYLFTRCGLWPMDHWEKTEREQERTYTHRLNHRMMTAAVINWEYCNTGNAVMYGKIYITGTLRVCSPLQAPLTEVCIYIYPHL